MKYCVCWIPTLGQGGYVTSRHPNRKPFATVMSDPDVKVWQSKSAAERWLTRKDQLWASNCLVLLYGISQTPTPDV